MRAQRDFLTRANNFLQWQFPQGVPSTFPFVRGLEGVWQSAQLGRHRQWRRLMAALRPRGVGRSQFGIL